MRGADPKQCIGTCAGASCPTLLADPGERPLWWSLSVLSYVACFTSFFPARGGARREKSGGAAAAWPPRSPVIKKLVYWILEQVYHTPRTLSSIWYSVFAGWFSLGCWWGSPRRSRALCSGPTITGGRSRSPSDSRRGLVPVAPPAPRPRREGRACAPRSSDIICSPPAALAADDTPEGQPSAISAWAAPHLTVYCLAADRAARAR